MRTIVAIGKEGLPLLLAGAKCWIKSATSVLQILISFVNKYYIRLPYGQSVLNNKKDDKFIGYIRLDAQELQTYQNVALYYVY